MMRLAVAFLSVAGTTASAEQSFDEETSLCLLQQKAAAVKGSWQLAGTPSLALISTLAEFNTDEAAASAALSEDGFQAVAALGHRELMRAYVRRVAKEEGLRITNEGALSGVLPYYTGECAKQSYSAIVRELHRGTEKAKCKDAWVEEVKHSSLLQTGSHPHAASKIGTENVQPHTTWHWAEDLEDSLGVLQTQLLSLKSAVAENEHIGKKVPLDQAGYEQVAAEGNTTEMALFAHRVAKHEGFEITNEKPLASLARYYSGECATQSLTALVKELHRVAGRASKCGGGPWLAPVKP